MVKSKKLLSLFLAVVMIFSTLSLMASALEYTSGGDIDNGINIKYSVEKVASTPETAAGSEAYTADNIYAVHIWMKASKGVDFILAPVHYNKAHFAPIVLAFEGVSYPAGAGMDQDAWCTDMPETLIAAYVEGAYLDNTGMYKADGSSVANKNFAKCIGIGNENSYGRTVKAELISADHPNYGTWSAGLPANTGIVYASVDVATKTKTAYLNTVSGHTLSTDWNRLFTLYFETLPGVTAADVAGDEFGVYTDNAFGFDGNFDATGSAYFPGATTYKGEVPAMNVVSNAVIEAAAEPTVEFAGTMGQMKNWEADYDAKTNPFNGGLVGKISNLPLTFPGGKCAEISHIYVTIKDAEGKETTKETYTVYPQKDGTYLFRAVVLGMDINNSTDTIQYKFIVELTTGGTLETEYSDPVSGASIYTAAKANFDAANA